ncbi:MAG: hypothetical protein ACMXYK_04140 [Candidatus Woesearchaeota archaeon]
MFDSKKDFLEYKRVLYKHKQKELKEQFDGASKSVFIGDYGYPKVQAGLLSAENYTHNEDQDYWISQKWGISKIADTRMDLINAKTVCDIKTPEGISDMQEIAISKKPVDVHINAKIGNSKAISYNAFHKPLGPSVGLESFEVQGNISVSNRVEKVITDDVDASEALHMLNTKGLSKDAMVQAFSVGLLGKDKKLVPTKWSITAVDDLLGKQLLQSVKDFQKTGNLVFTGSYLGNYFIVALYEGNFSYELFEFFRDAKAYSTDFEDARGRKSYAKDTAGGYYAARISVLEALVDRKRQAKALVLRFITDEYYMPLGVWVVRQAVKNTMDAKALEFGSEDLMFSYIKALVLKKFKRDLSFLHSKSTILSGKNLSDFWL